MERTPIVDAYFKRIGYTGPRTVSFDVLGEIQLRHATSIPFENLNPLLRLPVRLDIESIAQKLIHDRRGGYCFEHNLLLKHVLESLGFNVKGLAARVRWNAPADVVTARGHMLLLVDIETKRFIVDVGFGLLTPTMPLRLVPGAEQNTPHETFRIIMDGNDHLLQASINDSWKDIYRFDLQEQYLPDYELTNWYLSHNPDSHFVKGLIVDQPGTDRRYALHNNTFSVRYLNGTSEKTVLGNIDEIRDVLTRIFHIRLPETPNLDSTLETLIMTEPQLL